MSKVPGNDTLFPEIDKMRHNFRRVGNHSPNVPLLCSRIIFNNSFSSTFVGDIFRCTIFSTYFSYLLWDFWRWGKASFSPFGSPILPSIRYFEIKTGNVIFVNNLEGMVIARGDSVALHEIFPSICKTIEKIAKNGKIRLNMSMYSGA